MKPRHNRINAVLIAILTLCIGAVSTAGLPAQESGQLIRYRTIGDALRAGLTWEDLSEAERDYYRYRGTQWQQQVENGGFRDPAQRPQPSRLNPDLWRFAGGVSANLGPMSFYSGTDGSSLGPNASVSGNPGSGVRGPSGSIGLRYNNRDGSTSVSGSFTQPLTPAGFGVTGGVSYNLNSGRESYFAGPGWGRTGASAAVIGRATYDPNLLPPDPLPTYQEFDRRMQDEREWREAASVFTRPAGQVPGSESQPGQTSPAGSSNATTGNTSLPTVPAVQPGNQSGQRPTIADVNRVAADSARRVEELFQARSSGSPVATSGTRDPQSPQDRLLQAVRGNSNVSATASQPSDSTSATNSEFADSAPRRHASDESRPGDYYRIGNEDGVRYYDWQGNRIPGHPGTTNGMSVISASQTSSVPAVARRQPGTVAATASIQIP
ncbi:hypothetical protein GC176_21345 [bacterium]|nr:hypothetical protein [bacterium]